MTDDSRVIVEGNEKKSNYANLMSNKMHHQHYRGINYVTNVKVNI